MTVFRAFGVTDKGRIRPANEDCFAIHEELGLVVVADGMGGHNAGEVAARMAVDAIVEYFTRLQAAATEAPVDNWPFGFDPALSAEGNRMRTAILVANVQILESAITTDDYAGMGTTVVAARAVDGHLIVGHVGDSRLYRLSGGELQLLTSDDSWMAAILAHDPAADPVALKHHPMRHALTNVVGARSRTDVHIIEAPIADGDVVLLTTDGVHEVVDEQRLEQLLNGGRDLETAAQRIVDTALARGTRDNLTAVVARVSAG